MSGNNRFCRVYKYWFGLFKKPVSDRLRYDMAWHFSLYTSFAIETVSGTYHIIFNLINNEKAKTKREQG